MKENHRTIIGMIGPYPPNIGGTASFLSRLIPLLDQKGIHCEVFNTQKGEPGTGALERLERFFFFFCVGWKVLFSRCIIIHCHAVNWANLIGHTIVLILNRPFKNTVLTLHAGDLFSKITGKRTRLIAWLLLRLPQIVTTVTPELKDAVLSLGVRQVFFIPNDLSLLNDKEGLVPEYIQQFAADHRPLISAVGAMEKVHGMDVLIRAIFILKTTYPKLGVMIIAYKSINPVYQAEIEQLLSDLNLKNQVIFPTELPNVQTVVKLADVFVRPTLSDGDSIAVREALALGIRVVASNVGFRPQGVVRFPPGDYVKLAEKIIEVLRSPKEIQKTFINPDLETIEKYLRVYQVALNR